jgi:hypothetical protein
MDTNRALRLFLFLVLVTFSSAVFAQETASPEQTVETLRAQLLEAQAKETALQDRERQLDEDLKPENIERSLAGVGSTRPEELRESRRRQLSIERDGVRAQLKLVTSGRERLESLVRTAEAQAYQESAERSAPLLDQAQLGRKGWSFGWAVGLLAVIGEILGIVWIIAKMKRAKTT